LEEIMMLRPTMANTKSRFELLKPMLLFQISYGIVAIGIRNRGYVAKWEAIIDHLTKAVF
jgi:hypothetical protein